MADFTYPTNLQGAAGTPEYSVLRKYHSPGSSESYTVVNNCEQLLIAGSIQSDSTGSTTFNCSASAGTLVLSSDSYLAAASQNARYFSGRLFVFKNVPAGAVITISPTGHLAFTVVELG